MNHAPQCLDCQETMTCGVIPDIGYGVVHPLKWMEGNPPFDTSFWGRLRADGEKLDVRDAKSVVTYRCPQCGLLRSYAPKAGVDE